jgi:hypothetical protein
MQLVFSPSEEPDQPKHVGKDGKKDLVHPHDKGVKPKHSICAIFDDDDASLHHNKILPSCIDNEKGPLQPTFPPLLY